MKHQCMLMRSFLNFAVSYNILPSYEKILKFKTLRYPENITVEEAYAEVELQSLVDNTALSILQPQKVSIENDLLIGKWGFDGSTGHSEYKQKISKDDDKSLFVTSYVPL